ncbi:hypothetical protein V8F20_007808 [Naviculisporaceae sp. PSN 640]
MAEQMDIDVPEQTQTQTQTQPPQQTQQAQQKPKKPTSSPSSSSTRELTTCTIKHPPFSYVHLSTVSISPTIHDDFSQEEPQEIDPLQIRSYCTAALRQFLGDTGASILPDILLIRPANQDQINKQDRDSNRNGKGKGSRTGTDTDIYLRLARQDLATFTAAITAFPGLSLSIPTSSSKTGTGNGNGNASGGQKYQLLLQVQSCGDWLGSLIGKSEEADIWGL